MAQTHQENVQLAMHHLDEAITKSVDKSKPMVKITPGWAHEILGALANYEMMLEKEEGNKAQLPDGVSRTEEHGIVQDEGVEYSSGVPGDGIGA